MRRVLVTARAFGRSGTQPERALQDAGFEVVLRQMAGQRLAEDDLVGLLDGADAVIAGLERYTDGVLSRSPALRLVCRFGVGLDSVDLEAATRRGVMVAALVATNHVAVAEHTVGLMLAVARRIAFLDREVKQGRWTFEPGPELCGKTLGLVGLGTIGKQVARIAMVMGMHVVATEPRPDAEFLKEYPVRLAGLDQLLSVSDVVSLHLPLLPETRGILGRRALESMKPGSLLINTARGALVDEAALLDALDRGHLGGAGLDVMEREPPGDSRLAAHPRVVVTPHVAGLSTDSIRRMETDAVRTVIDVLAKGVVPDNVVNRRPAAGGRGQ